MAEIQISLAAARVNAEMTQDDVCKLMKVSKATIVNWESGKTSPSVVQARQLSSIYNMPLDFIRLPS